MTTYMQSSEGKMIAPSQRPDGTWRKARRVKEGYVPQEEVPLYESKGKLFAQRGSRPTGPVGGGGAAPPAGAQKTSSLMPPTNSSHGPTPAQAASNKQNKSAKAKQPQQQPAKAASNKSTAKAVAQPDPAAEVTAQIDRLTLSAEEEQVPEKLLKHAKKLRKKLREISNIEQKIKSGEIKSPDKDQLEKVGRKELIRAEVERLEKNPLLKEAEAAAQLQHKGAAGT